MADDAVRGFRNAAEEVGGGPPPSEEPPDGGGDGDERGDDGYVRLPEGCPVIPLGVSGDVCFYIDQLGQLREVKAKDHGRLVVLAMFGRRSDLLYAYWPRKTQQRSGEWVVTGWKPDLAQEALMAAAARRKVWNPRDCVRGPGAWAGADGELILHVGDALLVVPGARGDEVPGARGDEVPGARGDEVPGGQPGAAGDGQPWREVPAGLLEGKVYPTAPAGMRPHPLPQPAGPAGPANTLLDLFGSWNWRRKGLDEYLLLGWVGAAMLGGALSWRVLVWLTGGYGTGKSSLEEAVKWLMGSHGMLHSPDATAAALRQVLGYAALPVAIDEAEPDTDGRRIQGLVKFARDAATGAVSYRGGQDHQAAVFTIRSAIMLASILVPPLLPQDRSRTAILELGPLGQGEKPAGLTERKMGELGARLLRRLVDHWHRLDATLESYRYAMRQAGHDPRGQNVFGTLLALADLLLHDEPPDTDSLAGWQDKLRADTLAENDGSVLDERACLNHLLSTVLENPTNRQRYTVGRWVGRAAGKLDNLEDDLCAVANRLLHEVGCKVVWHDAQHWLAVANMHRGVAKVFQDTQWAARPGTQGGWVQALRRLPHHIPKNAIWFGVSSKATMVPLDLCLPTGGSPYEDYSAAGRSPDDGGGGEAAGAGALAGEPGTGGGASGRSAAETASSFSPDPDPFPMV